MTPRKTDKAKQERSAKGPIPATREQPQDRVSTSAADAATEGQTPTSMEDVRKMLDEYKGRGECSCAALCDCLLRFYELLNQTKEPTLERAELFTLTGDGDNKDHDTGIYVSVKTADGSTELASINGADSSGKDMTEYNDDSSRIVPLVIDAPGTTKGQSSGYRVHMWIKTNGDDTWDIDVARTTLYFSDGTNLVAEQTGFQLVNDGASTDFQNT